MSITSVARFILFIAALLTFVAALGGYIDLLGLRGLLDFILPKSVNPTLVPMIVVGICVVAIVLISFASWLLGPVQHSSTTMAKGDDTHVTSASTDIGTSRRPHRPTARV